jgi:hypothetical protein
MRVLLIVWVMAASLGSSLGRNLIVNGGFESPSMPSAAIETYADGSTNIPGWVVVVSHGYASRMTSGYRPFSHVNEFSTPFGSTMFDTDNFAYRGNAIAQTFPTTPGGAYHVSFFGSREPWQLREWMPASIVTLEVSVGLVTNRYTGDFNAGLVGGMNWKLYSFTFIATSNTSTLAFRQTEGPYEYDGACLDQVVVFPLRELALDRDGKLCFPSERNKLYKLQWTLTLPAAPDAWTDLASDIPGTGDFICRDTSVPMAGTRFYRLVESQ